MLTIDKVLEKSFRGSPLFKYVATRGAGHPDADHASWWTFEDEQSVRDRWWHPKAGETVLDIGAAFGSYALPALALGARVVCFSPEDFDTELLHLNLQQNPDLARRCLIVRDALHERAGWFDPKVSAFSESMDHGSMLKTRTLDSFLDERPGINRVGLIKMDVEGAELGVLQGGENCLRRDRPRILVENHEQHIPGIADKVHDYLVSLGVGYVDEGPVPHGVVSHSFFQVP